MGDVQLKHEQQIKSSLLANAKAKARPSGLFRKATSKGVAGRPTLASLHASFSRRSSSSPTPNSSSCGVGDGAAATVMRGEGIDCVIVGSDRIAANGDVANKIGTYGVAVLARRHGIPFYVAAPTSTVDLDLASGDQIPIEERRAEEVSAGMGTITAPAAAKIFNPAFDVTPHDLVSAIITEHGVARAPYEATLEEWVRATAQEAPA